MKAGPPLVLIALLTGCGSFLQGNADPGLSSKEVDWLNANAYLPMLQSAYGSSEFPESRIDKIWIPRHATLDGAASESYWSTLRFALASLGDKNFAEALSRQDHDIIRLVGAAVDDIWMRGGMDYPATSALVSAHNYSGNERWVKGRVVDGHPSRLVPSEIEP